MKPRDSGQRRRINRAANVVFGERCESRRFIAAGTFPFCRRTLCMLGSHRPHLPHASQAQVWLSQEDLALTILPALLGVCSRRDSTAGTVFKASATGACMHSTQCTIALRRNGGISKALHISGYNCHSVWQTASHPFETSYPHLTTGDNSAAY